MSKCRYYHTMDSPIWKIVTIRKHRFNGYEIVRGGKQTVSDRIADLEEAIRTAKEYCEYWGDTYGGLDEGVKRELYKRKDKENGR